MARRNLLVHNQGIVNEIYLDAVPSAPESPGSHVLVDRSYYNKAAALFTAIHGKVVGKLTENFYEGTPEDLAHILEQSLQRELARSEGRE
jgi:hypothetical protein